MSIEDSCDVVLNLLYASKIDRDDLHSRSIPDLDHALNILRKDGYLRRVWNPRGAAVQYNYYELTSKGRQFKETGGYANKDKLPRKANNIAIIALIATIVLAVVGFVLTIVFAG